MNVFGSRLCAAMYDSIAAISSFTLRKTPRRIRLSVMSLNHRSIRFSHELSTCSCGADLSRSGAVRGTQRRIRRVPMIVGCATAIALGGVLVGDFTLRRSGRTWWEVLPLDVTMFALRTNSFEAAAELKRRISAHAVPATTVAEVLKRGRGGHISRDFDLSDSLYEVVFGNPEVGTQFIADTCTVVAASWGIEWTPAADSPGTYRVPLKFRALEQRAYFVRIEAVRINGVTCEWSLAVPLPGTTNESVVGRRVFIDAADLCVKLGSPVSASGATLDVDLLIVTGPVWLAASLDPLIDSNSSAPRSRPLHSEVDDADNAWRVNAIIAPKTINVALPASGRVDAPAIRSESPRP